MKGQKPMYFTETDTLREIERLMQNIPNFPQKGHSIIILQSGNRIRDDCICCMHRRGRPPDYDCGYGESPCIVSSAYGRTLSADC